MNADPAFAGIQSDSRVYRLSPWALALIVMGGGGFVAGSLWLLWLQGSRAADPGQPVVLAVVGVMATAWGRAGCCDPRSRVDAC